MVEYTTEVELVTDEDAWSPDVADEQLIRPPLGDLLRWVCWKLLSYLGGRRARRGT